MLDDRMYVYSAMTGLRIGPKDDNARRRFRFCCALNPTVTEAGIGSLPDYIEQRTLPVIDVDYLPFEDVREIIAKSLEPSPQMLDAFDKWHKRNSRRELSVRQALSLMRYSMTLASQGGEKPAQAIEHAEVHTVGKTGATDGKAN